MPDKSPGGSRDMGGGGLVRGGRSWDQGGKADFRGQIHPAPKQNVSSGKGSTTSLGGRVSIPVKNTQSAPAPKMNVASHGPSGSNGGKDYHRMQHGGGTDHGPRGSGKTGGAGVTKG